MKFKTQLLLVTLFIGIQLNAGVHDIDEEKEPIAKKGVITGKIVDFQDKEPLEFTSVAVFTANDSSLVDGSITDADGSFRLSGLSKGKYYIVAKFVGYQERVLDDINIGSGQRVIELGEITLRESAQQLDEVEIIADQARVEYKIDRKVINVSQDINAATGTAADVLQNTPSVTVDIEGNVSLRGSENFTVLIDGKPTSLSGSEALQQIPASAIRNIEIITNPSAKYDPDGMAGIINIVSKKNALKGLSGIFNATVGTNDKYSGDFLINYRTDKFNFYGGMNYSDRTYVGTVYSEREFLGDPSSFVIIDGSRNMERGGFELKGGFDYNLNDKNTISFSAETGNSNFGFGGVQKMREYDEILSYNDYYVNDNFSDHERDYYDLNLSYTRTFDEKNHELVAMAYFSNEIGEDGDVQVEYPANSDYEIIDSFVPDRIRTGEDGDEQEFRFEVDYTRPIGETGKFEAGYQTRIDQEYERFLFEEYDPDFNEWFINEQYTNGNDFFRNIQALYSTYGNSLGEFQYQLGLRGEFTDRRIESEQGGDESVINRFDIFPTVHLSRSFENNHQVMASYSRRIDRPRSWYLEPFTNYMNSTTLRRGNPDLQPEYVNSFEVGYQKSFGKSFIAFETYFKNTVNKIERVITPYDADNNMILVTFDNISDDYSFGSELMLNYASLKWLELNASATLYRYWIEGEIDGVEIDTRSNNWNTRLNATFNISTKTRLQLTGFYNGPSVTAQGEREEFYYANIALRQDFLDRKLSATLQVRDIFGTMKYEFTSNGEGFESMVRFTREPQVVMLSLSYKLNNFKQRRGQNRGGGEMGGEGQMF
jgi:outer membrane receptor protein involved in Fe transport